MESILVFIVEDDPAYAEMLRYTVTRNPLFSAEVFLTGSEMLKNLQKEPAVICLDYFLPDLSGNVVLKRIREHMPDIPVVVISGQEDVRIATALYREGITDYIVKDHDTPNRIQYLMKHLSEKFDLKREIDDLREEVEKKYHYQDVIKGRSPVIRQVFNMIDKATRSGIPVMITGETGTGKDLVAKAIHFNSVRKRKPFVTVNVSGYTTDYIETELFGYEKGYLSTITARKTGQLQQAEKGTLYLDEITDLDYNLQGRLLKVIQDKEYVRPGGSEVVKLDFRMIVSSRKNIAEEIIGGRFREDLYYQLLGMPIELPPLRYRGEDILILAKYFIEQYSHDNKTPRYTLTPAAQEKLLRYSYPGNVRELKAVINLACVMTNSEMIDDVDISFNSSLPHSDFLMEENTLEEYNRKIIRFFLQKYNSNVLLVAEKLDIGKSTIYRMLKNKEI